MSVHDFYINSVHTGVWLLMSETPVAVYQHLPLPRFVSRHKSLHQIIQAWLLQKEINSAKISLWILRLYWLKWKRLTLESLNNYPLNITCWLKTMVEATETASGWEVRKSWPSLNNYCLTWANNLNMQLDEQNTFYWWIYRLKDPVHQSDAGL